MQKKLIALAIAGLASTAAFAQSNVTIYGRADFGVLNTSGNSGAVQNQLSTTAFASGLQAGSRLGFRGAEDLGNGLKAIFEIEYGLGIDQADSSNVAGSTAARPVGSSGTVATWVNRHSYVGLTGGFGTAVGGRLDGVRYGIFNKYDPFAGGTVGNFTQVTRQVDRANNAVAYITPNFGGFTGTFAYGTHILGANATTAGLGGLNAGTGEAAGNNGDLKLYTAMVNYANGPLDLTLDVERISADNIGVLPATGDLKDKITVATIAGSYDFGVVKVSALYDWLNDKLDGTSIDKKQSWMLGAKVPFGKFTGKINYGQSDDKLVSDADLAKWGIGVDYALSKRTNVYADFGSIRNDSNSSVHISAAANAYGPTGFHNTAGTQGVRGFDIGLAHNF